MMSYRPIVFGTSAMSLSGLLRPRIAGHLGDEAIALRFEHADHFDQRGPAEWHELEDFRSAILEHRQLAEQRRRGDFLDRRPRVCGTPPGKQPLVLAILIKRIDGDLASPPIPRLQKARETRLHFDHVLISK